MFTYFEPRYMNPFLNPITALPFFKNYLVDPGRIKRLNFEQMEKYRNKALRKSVEYAYKAPVYHKKYKKTHIYVYFSYFSINREKTRAGT